MKIGSREELVDFVNHGNKVKYVFFWGHRPPKTGVSKSCFSQWYASPFVIEGISYSTAEHYMMAEKARLFGDEENREKIITTGNPGEAKKLGRRVKGFEEHLWVKHCFDIVIAGNLAKFSQNPELKGFLLNTGNRVLVEASPKDRIWGIGLAADNPDVENPNLWQGLNLLGFALMVVRDQLAR